MLMQWLSIYNRNKKRRGRLPTFSDNPLVFRSVKRVGSVIVDEISKKKAENFDPATDIVDLEKYTDRESTTIGSETYETITFTVVGGSALYHIIDSVEKLDNVRNGRSLNYILANDIDLDIDPYNTGEGWDPIGTSSNFFTGKFNGNGFKISNLFINRAIEFVGLFGHSVGGAISNIGIVDCNVTGDSWVGGLVGSNRDRSTVTNSYSAGNVTGNLGVGGLVGYNYSRSTVTNSYSTGSVTGNNAYVGGLVGGNRSATITNSYSTGNITGSQSVGGLVGYNYQSSAITNSYYIGIRPSATNTTSLSLFCGANSSSTVTNSYACEIDEDGNDVDEPMRFTNTTTGVTDSGNKTTTDMKTQATYIDWDFTNIWRIDSNNDGYPYLRTFKSGDNNGELVGSKYIYLDGTKSNYMLIPDLLPSANYTNEMPDFTFCLNIEALERFQLGTNIYYVFGKYLSTGNQRSFSLALQADNGLGFVYSRTGLSGSTTVTYDVIYSGVLSDIEQIVIRYVNSTDTLTVCIDGVSTDYTLATKIYNGDADWGVNCASGLVPKRGSSQIKSVYVWDKALTDEEITMVNSLSFPAISDMVLGLPMSEGTGDTHYDVSGNSNHAKVYGETTGYWNTDMTGLPYSAIKGCSIIDGVDGEVPAVLGTQVDALNGDPLTNPATSKIVSNVDGYIKFPTGVMINVGTEEVPDMVPLFDRDNPTLYTDDARNSLDYLGAGYGLYWRIDKLNTANILSWMQLDYKFSWFVKNTFTDGTLDPITIKEIMAYNAPITGADNLSKMMKYLNLPAEVV